MRFGRDIFGQSAIHPLNGRLILHSPRAWLLSRDLLRQIFSCMTSSWQSSDRGSSLPAGEHNVTETLSTRTLGTSLLHPVTATDPLPATIQVHEEVKA